MRLLDTDKPITFVSGFWSIRDSPKHSEEDFSGWIPRTLSFLCSEGEALMFFHQSSVPPSFLEPLLKHPQTCQRLVVESIDELDPELYSLVLKNATSVLNKYRWVPNVVRAIHPPLLFREKGFRKIFQARRTSIEVYARLTQIYLSKINLVSRAIEFSERAPSDSDLIAWVDAGFSRQLSSGSIPDRGFRLREDKINLIQSPMRYRLRRMNGSGKLIVAPKFQWDWLRRVFPAQLNRMSGGAYLHDDETVIAELWSANPGRFARLEGD